MKPVGIFQGIYWKIDNTSFQEFLRIHLRLVISDSSGLQKVPS